MNANRVAEAVDWFNRAVEANPVDAGLVASLGLAYFRQNRYAEAITAFERSLPSLVGERTGLPRVLALAYVIVGDDAKARQVLLAEGRSDRDADVQLDALRVAARARAR